VIKLSPDPYAGAILHDIKGPLKLKGPVLDAKSPTYTYTERNLDAKLSTYRLLAASFEQLGSSTFLILLQCIST
jgi:hypothetical protein